MNNECSIVKDLLALYSEDMVSEGTAQFIANHLESCEECSREYKQMKGEKSFDFSEEKAPIKDIKKKIVKKRIATAVLSVFLVLTILLTGYAVLSTREFFEYSDDLMTITSFPAYDGYYADKGSNTINYYQSIESFNSYNNAEQSGVKSTKIIFDKKVTGCSYYLTTETVPDIYSDSYYNYTERVYHIEAWTSKWDKMVGFIREKLGKEQPCQTLEIESDSYFALRYSPNNGQSEIDLSDKSEMNGYALPRLVLNYYLIFAAGALIVAAVLLVIFRKKEKVGKIMTYITFVPLSYIISQLAVMGFNATTYSVMRDFKLIIVLSIFILCILISVYRIIQVKKEIKEINKLN